MAAKMGFRELVNYDALGITFPANTVTILRQTISKRPEMIENFLKILIEGIYVFKTNKAKSLAVMKKHHWAQATRFLRRPINTLLLHWSSNPILPSR
jgi:hypothetical protein